MSVGELQLSRKVNLQWFAIMPETDFRIGSRNGFKRKILQGCVVGSTRRLDRRA